MSNLPSSTQVLVIGGGPAGSTAATLLARQGIDVTICERDVFPRYHIGESLLPSALEIFDLLGVREKIENYGFQRKTGAYLQWRGEEWTLRFSELSGNHTYSYQVCRAEFDQLLLEHAKSQGVKVFEGTGIRQLSFEGERPQSATWTQTVDGEEKKGEISFDYLIDASGRTGVMATRYLKNRRHHEVFQNIAIWGYWKNAKRLEGEYSGAIAFGSVAEGWWWAIPLHDGTMSVGVVLHKSYYQARQPISLEEIYNEALAQSDLVSGMIAPGERITELKVEQDYSYTADIFSGPGYFLSGDAACFLDPLLSSGIHLATYSALLAAASISSVLRGEITEQQAATFYEKSYRQVYLRFLVFVSSFYDQNQAKESYFWTAQRLTRHDFGGHDLKQAFLTLISGVEDLNDAKEVAPELIMQEMSKRIQENLSLRQNKEELESRLNSSDKAVKENAQFFSAVEGLFSFSAAEAIDGLYVTTEPQLGVARANLATQRELELV